jgi:hypothetical protein
MYSSNTMVQLSPKLILVLAKYNRGGRHTALMAVSLPSPPIRKGLMFPRINRYMHWMQVDNLFLSTGSILKFKTASQSQLVMPHSPPKSHHHNHTSGLTS